MNDLAKKALWMSAALTACGISAQELSQEDAQTAYETRHAVFQLLSFSNSQLVPMSRGAPFDQGAAITAAERIAMHAAMIPEVFAVDTRGIAGLNTRAADSIWENKEAFDALAMDLKTGAEAAIEVLRTQGESGIRSAVQQIGPKCGACHDNYRLNPPGQ